MENRTKKIIASVVGGITFFIPTLIKNLKSNDETDSGAKATSIMFNFLGTFVEAFGFIMYPLGNERATKLGEYEAISFFNFLTNTHTNFGVSPPTAAPTPPPPPAAASAPQQATTTVPIPDLINADNSLKNLDTEEMIYGTVKDAGKTFLALGAALSSSDIKKITEPKPEGELPEIPKLSTLTSFTAIIDYEKKSKKHKTAEAYEKKNAAIINCVIIGLLGTSMTILNNRLPTETEVERTRIDAYIAKLSELLP